MLLSGIQPFTLLDYPDRVSCIVFTPGCNFRCGFCHNPEFVLPERLQELKGNFLKEENFFNFLKGRQGLLDGVVVSGGEPTTLPDLPQFIAKIKALGYLVKLDTNGNRPDVLQKLYADNLLDYVAMDIKTDIATYTTLVGPNARAERLTTSMSLLKNSGQDYEFRSTLIKEIHTPTILQNMTKLLQGARKLYLQYFRPGVTLDSAYEKFHPFLPEEMEQIKKLFETVVPCVIIR